MKTKKLVIASLLVALAIIIPNLSLPVVPTPEFSVTLFAHVPVMLGMFISPVVGALTAIGSAIGFFLKGLPLVVPMRALSHVIFAFIGGYMLLKLNNKYKVLLTYFVTMVLHVFSEVVVVAFWFKVKTFNIALNFGTPIFALHHTFDFIITVIIYIALEKAKMVDKRVLNR